MTASSEAGKPTPMSTKTPNGRRAITRPRTDSPTPTLVRTAAHSPALAGERWSPNGHSESSISFTYHASETGIANWSGGLSGRGGRRQQRGRPQAHRAATVALRQVSQDIAALLAAGGHRAQHPLDEPAPLLAVGPPA